MQYTCVSFDIAKLALEKGFDWDISTGIISCVYDVEDKELTTYANYNSTTEGYIKAPTQSYLQKWLREVHDIHIINNYIHSEKENKYEFIVFDNRNKKWGSAEIYNTYEEGLEDKLGKALKLIS